MKKWVYAKMISSLWCMHRRVVDIIYDGSLSEA